jgi:cyclopropane-fatty-acyl-phospholipid synthase
MDPVMELVERGVVPDALVRAGIRRLCERKLAAVRSGGPEAMARRDEAVRAAMRAAPIALHTREANVQHYEVPAAYYERVLGPRLKYSSALWDGASTLAEAEEAMLAVTAERAGLADGQRILELGCGWGSLTLWMAEHYPAARILAVSNSATQRVFILERAAQRGLTNVEVVTADMNAFAPPEGARFDRVVSVEMFEHMRNWEALLERIRGWLTPEGALFVHVFCLRDATYFYEVDGRSDWLARHFFTGGLMPAEDLLERCATGYRLDGRWRVNGTHYERTSLAWLARQDAARDALMPVMAATYGAADAARWFRRWRVFHLACADLFGLNGGEDWFVSHARLVPRA